MNMITAAMITAAMTSVQFTFYLGDYGRRLKLSMRNSTSTTRSQPREATRRKSCQSLSSSSAVTRSLTVGQIRLDVSVERGAQVVVQPV